MEKRFLRSYMDLLVQTCHRRGALATGGMAALLLPQDPLSESHKRVLATVTRWVVIRLNAESSAEQKSNIIMLSVTKSFSLCQPLKNIII